MYSIVDSLKKEERDTYQHPSRLKEARQQVCHAKEV